MILIMLGAQGTGKGTVAGMISKETGLPQISTGDIFRKNISEKTPLGIEADKYISKGELVPDEVTVPMVEDRLTWEDAQNGVILDGFPRTVNQAMILDKLLEKKGIKMDMALNIDVPFDEIVKRISDRRSCKGCSAIYNIVFNPPKQEGKCDKCGGELYQREDQKPEVVQNRLEVYKKTADEIIKYYEAKNILRTEKAGDKAGRTSYDVAGEIEEELRTK